jgi:hypothetical protein
MDNRTVEILKRFEASWSQTKARFDELIVLHENFKRLVAVREFIAELELAGGKQLYRLGTSMHMLIISRSVDHGLRADQKSILVEAIALDDFEVILRDGERIYRQYRVKDLKDTRMTKLLQTLESTLID